MGVTVEQKFIVTDESKGSVYVFSKAEIEKIRTTSDMSLVCDGGHRCAARRGTPEPLTINWNQEQGQKDPSSTPDDFFRIIEVITNLATGERRVFCGPRCLKTFLDYEYIPPKSPREQNEALKDAQEKKLGELNPHLVGQTKTEITDDGLVRKVDSPDLPSAEDLDRVAEEQSVADATEYPV